jgi:hypothetical protein
VPAVCMCVWDGVGRGEDDAEPYLGWMPLRMQRRRKSASFNCSRFSATLRVVYRDAVPPFVLSIFLTLFPPACFCGLPPSCAFTIFTDTARYDTIHPRRDSPRSVSGTPCASPCMYTQQRIPRKGFREKSARRASQPPPPKTAIQSHRVVGELMNRRFAVSLGWVELRIRPRSLQKEADRPNTFRVYDV